MGVSYHPNPNGARVNTSNSDKGACKFTGYTILGCPLCHTFCQGTEDLLIFPTYATGYMSGEYP
jgi:hypothetical protein